MSIKIIIQSTITLSVFALSLYLFSHEALLLTELGKATLLLSVVTLFPLAESFAKTQLMEKQNKSIPLHQVAEDHRKKKVA